MNATKNTKKITNHPKHYSMKDLYECSHHNTEDIIGVYDEYVKLLGEEIDSFIGLAMAHGWKSTEERIKRGKELRTRIAALKPTHKE